MAAGQDTLTALDPYTAPDADKRRVSTALTPNHLLLAVVAVYFLWKLLK